MRAHDLEAGHRHPLTVEIDELAHLAAMQSSVEPTEFRRQTHLIRVDGFVIGHLERWDDLAGLQPAILQTADDLCAAERSASLRAISIGDPFGQLLAAGSPIAEPLSQTFERHEADGRRPETSWEVEGHCRECGVEIGDERRLVSFDRIGPIGERSPILDPTRQEPNVAVAIDPVGGALQSVPLGCVAAPSHAEGGAAERLTRRQRLGACAPFCDESQHIQPNSKNGERGLLERRHGSVGGVESSRRIEHGSELGPVRRRRRAEQ
ncbi:hypothetical protein [Methylosinus sp. LW4]|uniref:hypothetical protein n=1 Tax=Methylosinus sp. LW4 TaxID=136993 RepID=UPI0018DED8FB|nr:hypothetical protein [Methylosinus sp. LW4]